MTKVTTSAQIRFGSFVLALDLRGRLGLGFPPAGCRFRYRLAKLRCGAICGAGEVLKMHNAAISTLYPAGLVRMKGAKDYPTALE